MGLLSVLLGVVGCDPQRIARRLEPEKIWEAADLMPTPFPAQPLHMVTIGPDGRMSALRQVRS
jgi:hypothetical protein